MAGAGLVSVSAAVAPEYPMHLYTGSISDRINRGPLVCHEFGPTFKGRGPERRKTAGTKEKTVAHGRQIVNFAHRTGALALACWLGSAGAAAAQQKDLGTFRDWSARSYQESGQKICDIFSKPKKEEGRYTRRGDVFAFVVYRPQEGQRNEVSFEIGYTFKQDSELRATIGGRTFELFTDGGGAWLRTAAEDDSMVAAMKAGSTMIVRGTSSRGTATKDTYSLSGFTAAMNAIVKECGA